MVRAFFIVERAAIYKLTIQIPEVLQRVASEVVYSEKRSQFSSVVEQRFCKPSVVGSSPTTGSSFDVWASGGCERPGGNCQQNCQQTGNLAIPSKHSPTNPLKLW